MTSTVVVTLAAMTLCLSSITPVLAQWKAEANVKQNRSSNILSIETLCRKKDHLSAETFDQYWTNVHATLATSAQGFDEYWTHRFGPVKTDLFPNVRGIDYDLPIAEQFSGAAQITITSVPRMQALFQNPVTPLILEDEQNLFSQTKPLVANPGNSFLLKNNVLTNTVTGGNTQPTYHVFFQKTDGTTVEAFRKFIKDTMSTILTDSEDTAKVNLHLVEPYQDNVWPSPQVNHTWNVAKQYQAYLEIVFVDAAAAKNFFLSPAYKATEAEQPRYLKSIHAYPIRETYTFIAESKPTLTGLRGATIAGVILQVNARNQLREDVLKQTVNATMIPHESPQPQR